MNTENNKLIAEFMNCRVGSLYFLPQHNTTNKKLKGYANTFALDELKYHSDWNWLMEVVDKIIDTIEISAFQFIYRVQWCEIRMNSQLALALDYVFPAIEKDGGIEGVYEACVEFIKWYNQQNK